VSTGQRVELAREYLADVRRTGVEQLPPSVLMRECAELRRQLGVVLAVIRELESQRPEPVRPMCTDDLDPGTEEAWGVEVEAS
jgi:hypothetical protein